MKECMNWRQTVQCKQCPVSHLALFSCIGKTRVTLRTSIGRGFIAHAPPHPCEVDIVSLVYCVMV